MEDNLVDLLKKILALYEKLLALTEKKNQALQKVDVPMMKEILTQEQALIKEIQRVEEKRCRAAQRERADQAAESLYQRLGGVIAEVREISRRNDRLTRQTLELIGYKINILNETSVGTTYAAEGLASVCEKKYLDFKA